MDIFPTTATTSSNGITNGVVKQSPQTRAMIITVTPQMASRWLGNNPSNRSLSEDRVVGFASDMKAGRWDLHGQGITIGPNDELLDGQHRLSAVVVAKVDVNMLVVYVANPDARRTVDIGRARSYADWLQFRGLANARRVVSVVRAIASTVEGSSRHMGTAQIDGVIKAYQGGIDFGISLYSLTELPRLTNAPVLAGIAIAYDTNPAAVRAFGERYIGGAGLTERSPELMLRNAILGPSYTKGSHTSRDATLKTLRAIRAHLEGSKIGVLRAYTEVVEFFAAPRSA
jgi:hypothetical protein